MKTISGRWKPDEGAVTLIDAHHQLWDLRANHYPWLSIVPSVVLSAVVKAFADRPASKDPLRSIVMKRTRRS